uniref:Secreted protein n=1 Tax=Ixodes ricinus TaxID=34613 RepID=A0A6B0TT05_IXORI
MSRQATSFSISALLVCLSVPSAISRQNTSCRTAHTTWFWLHVTTLMFLPPGGFHSLSKSFVFPSTNLTAAAVT